MHIITPLSTESVTVCNFMEIGGVYADHVTEMSQQVAKVLEQTVELLQFDEDQAPSSIDPTSEDVIGQTGLDSVAVQGSGRAIKDKPDRSEIGNIRQLWHTGQFQNGKSVLLAEYCASFSTCGQV